MSDQPGKSHSSRKINLGSEKLKKFFVNHLNRIYFAKAHLVQRLPQLKNEVYFNDLQLAIEETVEDVEKQMARMEVIYELLDAEISKGSINGLTGLVDDAFEAIREQSGEAELRDMSIIFYLQNIESVEMASFQVLQMAAVKLKSKQIKQLLSENYDEAKADRTLLLLIAAKYITK
jgi:ferritin-like metal-binding protein YciE